MIGAGSFSGYFDLKVYDAYTGKLTKSRSFPNLITNQGLASYCGASPSFYTSKICVGKGTTAPAPEDTRLSDYLAVSNTNLGSGTLNGGDGNYGAPDYISWAKGTARFNAGVFDGTNLTEIGVTNTDSSHPVFSRALILDAQGRPSAITILSNEYLDVTYTLLYHPDLTDTEFSFVMNEVTYNCVARAAHVNNSALHNTGSQSPFRRGLITVGAVYNSQTLGAVTSEPVYSSGGKINTNSTAYNPSHIGYSTDTPYTHKCRVGLGTAQCNFDGGIGAMLFANFYSDGAGILSESQVSFTPKLPKDANTEMTFVLAKTVARWTAPSP